MPRIVVRSQFALPAVLVISLAMALLPRGWRVGWQGPLARAAAIPFEPFANVLNSVGSWLTPPPSIVHPDEMDLEAVTEDRDRAVVMYHNSQARVRVLEEQVQALESLPEAVRSLASRQLVAHVTTRNPDSALGVVRLRMQGDTARLVTPNTLAVYSGAHILGRTIGEPMLSQVTLAPITHPSTQWVHGRIHDAEAPMGEGLRVHLRAAGNGVFIADVERDRAFVGDVVRLDDTGWSPAAQGLILGTIESVEPNDDEPLRRRIVVRPQFVISDVAVVTLIIEETSAVGSMNGEGAP